MLERPRGCRGCPLDGVATGFMRPTLTAGAERSVDNSTNSVRLQLERSLPLLSYRVALVGEALGESEAELGAPFVGRAGFKLSRLLEWAGLRREGFDIWNVCWCRPPDNALEGTPYELGAVEHCRSHHWGHLTKRVDVVVPMGNVALHAFTGRKGILRERGYIQSRVGDGFHLLPTVHPSFIQRGQSKYSAAFIHDIQKAVGLAETGIKFESTQYLLDPSPSVAYQWARKYVDLLDMGESGGMGKIRLAYDIETPNKGEDEGALEDDDPTYFIWRVGFAYTPLSALSVPFTPEYLPAIKLLLGGEGEKVVWNAGFDNPRLRHNGVEINGIIHDGMVAWHILHSDLPKGLGFVATFTCPFQPAWKHLSHQQPAFYNATDADVELRSFLTIEEELIKSGLWEVYQKDVLDLEPILIHMSKMGMPLDGKVREAHARELATRQSEVMGRMASLIPLEGRRKKVFTNDPKDTTDLITVTVEAPVQRCSICGGVWPTKSHFRTFKRPTLTKPQNPCAGGEVREKVEEVKRFARLEPFKPSRQQLIVYQGVMGRQVPTTWDKKTKSRKPTMDEKALKGLMLKYPLDPLYPLVLKYRELDKIGGTYIGRPDVPAGS